MNRLDPQPTPDQNPEPIPYRASEPTPDQALDPTSRRGPDEWAGSATADGFQSADMFQPADTFQPWRYRDDAGVTGADLVGYHVETTNGGIGKIDRANYEVDTSFLVVDTGPWIFGKKVLLPAGVVNHVDHDDRKVYVDRDKAQIKAAPDYNESDHTDPVYLDKIGGYYGGMYGLPGTPPVRPDRPF
jgi:hypothetical protein